MWLTTQFLERWLKNFSTSPALEKRVSQPHDKMKTTPSAKKEPDWASMKSGKPTCAAPADHPPLGSKEQTFNQPTGAFNHPDIQPAS